MIAWRIQEKFYGGHDKAITKLLDGLVRGEAEKLEPGPRLKRGTVLMRETRKNSKIDRQLRKLG